MTDDDLDFFLDLGDIIKAEEEGDAEKAEAIRSSLKKIAILSALSGVASGEEAPNE